MIQKISMIVVIFYASLMWSKGDYSEYFYNSLEEYIHPDDVVSQYINEINSYCEDEYNPDNQYTIEDDILTSPNANLTSDVPDAIREKCPAGDYLYFLKKYNVKVRYSNFKTFKCRFNGQETLGAIVKKSVRLADGSSQNYEEFLELIKRNNSYRIASISSNLFQESYQNINCNLNNGNTDVDSNQPCEILKLAHQAYADGNYANAIQYYLESLSCQGVGKTIIENRISELNKRNNITSYFQKAEMYFNHKDYEKALQLYQLILDNKNIKILDATEIKVKADLCRAYINYESVIQKADFFYKRGFYEQALANYKVALQWKPNESSLTNKINRCNEKIRQNYQVVIKKEILNADREMSRGKKVIANGITLMKYEKSGYLTAKQYFFLAQIADNRERKFKDKFNLTDRDCCVLSRRFALKAQEMGYQSDSMEDFWLIHFNENSRICR